MKVNAELKKDLQRNFEIKPDEVKRKHSYFSPMPEDVCREELHQVLIGTEDVPRRVIRAIANVAQRPVSAYLGGENNGR